jgi:uncharacterized protein YndB with AHSA1/START domain
MILSVAPSTIQLKRRITASPAHIFSAWSDPSALLRWGTPGPGWDVVFEAFEFEVGGFQITRFSPVGNAKIFVNRYQFQDIAAGSRIVSSGSMTLDGKPIFVGVLAVEFEEDGADCLMRLTEQGVFLDGRDQRENHLHGWSSMLDQLEAAVGATGAGGF